MAWIIFSLLQHFLMKSLIWGEIFQDALTVMQFPYIKCKGKVMFIIYLSQFNRLYFTVQPAKFRGYF